MPKEYVAVLAEDEDSCAVKKVSQNSFYQIKDMLGDGEDAVTIVESIVELSTTENNILKNGLTKEEAIEYAEDVSDDYVVLEVY
ncbi:hypothetical protein [Clostridium thermarum]|uniref:hypothetical protein n=1 Tax=Clostridium thermarum TaxID=1716543 RepID=UPI001122C4DC|nr:hypothetical protein [Clostridium thermarum]